MTFVDCLLLTEGDVSDVEEAAFAEEQEALDIQKRMLATLQEDDFDLERFKVLLAHIL
jgi:hypothetical protein